MAADKLKYASGNSASTTLSTSMTNTDTTTPLTSSTNFDDAPTAGAGVVLIDEGTASEELAYSTGISGASLTTPLANRGIEGGSAQGHDAGASVRGIFTAGMWNDVIDSLKNLVLATTGAVDTTKIVDVASAQTISGAKTFSAAPLFTFGTEANGDVFYGNGSGQLQRLPVGSNGNVLTLASGVPSWATPTAVVDGWTPVSDSWSYASASTVTVPSGAASLYKKGDKVKFTQTTVKYFVITGVADTVLTFAVNTDYVVANAAISAISYSHQDSPIGFPTYFTYAPTWTADSGVAPAIGNGTIVGRYNITSNGLAFVEIIVTMGSSSTYASGGTAYRLDLPVAYANSNGMLFGCAYDDSSTAANNIFGYGEFAATTKINLRRTGGNYVYTTTPFTWANGDSIRVSGSYFI